MKKTILFMLTAVLILFSAPAVQAAANTEDQEIEAYVRETFPSFESPDMDQLKNYDLGEEDLAMLQLLKDHGLHACRIHEILSYPLDQSSWIVFVNYEIEIREPDFLMPGMYSFYITKDDTGSLNMLSELDGAAMQSLEEKAKDIAENPEIMEMTEEINKLYQQLIENDTDGKIQKWMREMAYDLAAFSYTKSEALTDDSQDSLYTVQKGDCLWDIAETYAGAGQEWHTLYENNRSVIGEDPSLIFPGQKLSLDF